MSTNGPAITLLLTNNRNRRRYSIDLTPVIKDKSWPEDADEWKSRSRGGITNKTLLFLLFQLTWRAWKHYIISGIFSWSTEGIFFPCFHGAINHLVSDQITSLLLLLLLFVVVVVVSWLLYISRCYNWLYIGRGKQQVTLREINQNPVILSYLQHFSQYLCTTQQCYTLDESKNNFDIIYLLLVGVSNYCLSAIMVLFLMRQQPLVIMTPAPTAHIFWTSLEEILILFNLLFLHKCFFPTIFWNCLIYNLSTFLTLINNYQMWPSDLKFFVSNLLIFSDRIASGIA